MCTVKCFVKFKLCTSWNNIFLVGDVVVNHLTKCKNFRLFVYKCKQDDAESILHLCILEQIVKYNIRVCVTFKFDNKTNMFGRFVTSWWNTVNLAVTNKFVNMLFKLCFVYLIRYFCDNNSVSVIVFFYFGFRTKNDFSATCCISVSYTAFAHNNAAGWEIGTLNMSHKFLGCYHRVVYNCDYTVNNFCKIVRRNICRHTDCDTGRAVYNQIRKSWRKNVRLF